MNACRILALLATRATALAALGWLIFSGAPSVAAQASAVCDGAPAGCVVSSSEQLALAPGQTISRVLACPEDTPTLTDSTYTTSNPTVVVTQAALEKLEAALG